MSAPLSIPDWMATPITSVADMIPVEEPPQNDKRPGGPMTFARACSILRRPEVWQVLVDDGGVAELSDLEAIAFDVQMPSEVRAAGRFILEDSDARKAVVTKSGLVDRGALSDL